MLGGATTTTVTWSPACLLCFPSLSPLSPLSLVCHRLSPGTFGWKNAAKLVPCHRYVTLSVQTNSGDFRSAYAAGRDLTLLCTGIPFPKRDAGLTLTWSFDHQTFWLARKAALCSTFEMSPGVGPRFHRPLSAVQLLRLSICSQPGLVPRAPGPCFTLLLFYWFCYGNDPLGRHFLVAFLAGGSFEFINSHRFQEAPLLAQVPLYRPAIML